MAPMVVVRNTFLDIADGHSLQRSLRRTLSEGDSPRCTEPIVAEKPTIDERPIAAYELLGFYALVAVPVASVLPFQRLAAHDNSSGLSAEAESVAVAELDNDGGAAGGAADDATGDVTGGASGGATGGASGGASGGAAGYSAGGAAGDAAGDCVIEQVPSRYYHFSRRRGGRCRRSLKPSRRLNDTNDTNDTNNKRCDIELPLGNLHEFFPGTTLDKHVELSKDRRIFTKVNYHGRLTIVTDSHVHYRGVERYVVQFLGGALSDADGVGFVFSPSLPCSQNIQRITSVFLNRDGRVCTRRRDQVYRTPQQLTPLALGDVVMMTVDLPRRCVEFNVLRDGEASHVHVSYEASAEDNYGYFACVVKNSGVTLRLWS
jgi:hypothetical protein